MLKDEVIKCLSELAKVRDVIVSFHQDLGELEDQAFLNCPDLNVRRHEILQALKAVEKKSSELTEVVRVAVLESGESIKGEELQAVFAKGKTTWNAKALEGYAVAHPELEKLKKTGSPSVSIREVKEGKDS